jgi:hypothetical protein
MMNAQNNFRKVEKIDSTTITSSDGFLGIKIPNLRHSCHFKKSLEARHRPGEEELKRGNYHYHENRERRRSKQKEEREKRKEKRELLFKDLTMKSYQRCFGALLSKRFKLKDF